MAKLETYNKKDPYKIKMIEYSKNLKRINFCLSLFPLIFSVFFYTLYFRAQSYGIIEIKGGFIPDKIYYHYKITEILFNTTFITLIINLFFIGTLVYFNIKNKIKITMSVVFYLIGVAIFFYVMRIDSSNAVTWFFD